MMGKWGRADRKGGFWSWIIMQRTARKFMQAKRQEGKSSHVAMNTVEHAQEAMRLFNNLNDLRNDLAHCGMRSDPITAKSAIDNVKKRVKNLEDFICKTRLI